MSYANDKLTLYVIPRRGDVLSKYGETLRIKDEESGEVRQKVPVLALRDVVMMGNANLEADVFGLLAESKVPVHFLSTGGKYRGSLTFDPGKNLFLRHAQFRHGEDPQKKRQLAQWFVEGKIVNCNRLFQKFRIPAKLDFPADAERLSVDQLRGVEGTAAKLYFALWGDRDIIKNEDFGWRGRNRRPPLDPVNALLSLCSSMLHTHIQTLCNMNGLDPYIGYLHEAHYGRPSLVCDLVEEFRAPVVENFVLKTINRREFALSDFEEEVGGAVKFSKEGFGKFFPKWSEHLTREEVILSDDNVRKTWSTLCERQVRRLVHYLMEDTERYVPLKW